MLETGPVAGIKAGQLHNYITTLSTAREERLDGYVPEVLVVCCMWAHTDHGRQRRFRKSTSVRMESGLAMRATEGVHCDVWMRIAGAGWFREAGAKDVGNKGRGESTLSHALSTF